MAYSDISHDHEHYAWFRAHLQERYEEEVDYLLDKTVVLFERLCKVPVLLSMLVVALNTEDGEEATVPRDLHDLYAVAVTKAVRRWFKVNDGFDTAQEERTPRVVSSEFAYVDHATLRLTDGGSFYAPGELTSVAVQGPRLVVGAQSGELYHLSVVPSAQNDDVVA